MDPEDDEMTEATSNRAFFDPITDLDDESEGALLDIARSAIDEALLGQAPSPRSALPASTSRPGASFVTVRRDGELRGCIGSMTPVRSVAADVAHNAVAATRDPRLPPITPTELVDLDIKISVLTPLQPLDVTSRAELLAVLQPGVDGIAIGSGPNRATFLPSVWEQLPEPDDFLDQLWRKAGLKSRHWPDDLVVEHYRTVEIG